MQSNEILDNCKSLKFREPGSEFHGSYLVDWSPHSILINHSRCYLLCLKSKKAEQKKKNLVLTQIYCESMYWGKNKSKIKRESQHQQGLNIQSKTQRSRYHKALQIKISRTRLNRHTMHTLIILRHIRQQMELSKWKTHENSYKDWIPLSFQNIKSKGEKVEIFKENTAHNLISRSNCMTRYLHNWFDHTKTLIELTL